MGWFTFLLENGAVIFSDCLWEHKACQHIQVNCTCDDAVMEERFNSSVQNDTTPHINLGGVVNMLN
jgi:hypothetical protein